MDQGIATQFSGTITNVPISSQYDHCKNSFNKLLKNLETSDHQAFGQRLLNELGRLRVWAGNAGAHRTGRVSLDYRLREASDVYEELAKLLGKLNKNLGQGGF